MYLKIAVVCSDARMRQVYAQLASTFDVVHLDQENDFLLLPMLDAIVFPITGPDISGYLAFEERTVQIPSQFWEMQSMDLRCFCGMKNLYLERLSMHKYYYMEDAQVIHANAILTAEGVLNEFIGCCSKSIYDVCVDVIGYGNCGKVIYEMLHNLHVQVRVIRRACEKGEDFIEVANWKECGDVIINTSLQKLIDKKRMEKWTKKPVILDIATPDVVDVQAAQALGIRVIKAGNLPGRYASVSAGNIIACFVRGKLKDEG